MKNINNNVNDLKEKIKSFCEIWIGTSFIIQKTLQLGL